MRTRGFETGRVDFIATCNIKCIRKITGRRMMRVSVKVEGMHRNKKT